MKGERFEAEDMEYRDPDTTGLSILGSFSSLGTCFAGPTEFLCKSTPQGKVVENLSMVSQNVDEGAHLTAWEKMTA